MPSALKRIEDQSHLILDVPPAAAKKGVTAAAPVQQSSAQKLRSLQVPHAKATRHTSSTQRILTMSCRRSFIPLTSASLVVVVQLRIVLYQVGETSFQRGATAALSRRLLDRLQEGTFSANSLKSAANVCASALSSTCPLPCTGVRNPSLRACTRNMW